MPEGFDGSDGVGRAVCGGEGCWGVGRGGVGQYAEGRGAGGVDAVGLDCTWRAHRQTPTQCLRGRRVMTSVNAEGKGTPPEAKMGSLERGGSQDCSPLPARRRRAWGPLHAGTPRPRDADLEGLLSVASW